MSLYLYLRSSISPSASSNRDARPRPCFVATRTRDPPESFECALRRSNGDDMPAHHINDQGQEYHLLAPEINKESKKKAGHVIIPLAFVAVLARRSSTADDLSGLMAALMFLVSGVGGGGRGAGAAGAAAAAFCHPREGATLGLPGTDASFGFALLC